MKKAVIGFSGGVDSAVSARILLEKGYQVHAVYLDGGFEPEGADNAKRLAGGMGLYFERVDIAAELEEKVCRVFAASYLTGKTPNPCVICNPEVKFRSLFRVAEREDAPFVATGHYAGVAFSEEYGCTLITKALSGKDQSYMLSRLPREYIDRLIFPLAEVSDKEEVRSMAAELISEELASKPDSMEICFIPGGDYAGWIEARGVIPPEGSFLDRTGRVVGRHCGIHHYTVGQRKHLGISLGCPMYVSAIDGQNNTVTLSRADEECVRRLELEGFVEQAELGRQFEAELKVRHSHLTYRAHVTMTGGGRAIVETEEPVRMAAPGQTAACYDGKFLLGGGFINRIG